MQLFFFFRIPVNVFAKAAQEISEVFVTENPNTYFIPYKPKTKTSPRLLPSGKLWSKYTNFKRTLSVNDITLVPNVKTSTVTSSSPIDG